MISLLGAGLGFPFSAAIMLQVRAERPAMPRWAGYYNLWVGVGFVVGALVFCFHDGPFAWNGVIAFWLALTIFGTWFPTMGVVLHHAIGGQERAEAGSDPAPVGQPETV